MDAYYIGSLGTMKITLGAELLLMNLRRQSSMTIFLLNRYINLNLQVHNDDEVRALFKQVQGEVPGSPIFIMKVAAQVRYQVHFITIIIDSMGHILIWLFIELCLIRAGTLKYSYYVINMEMLLLCTVVIAVFRDATKRLVHVVVV